MVLGPLCFHSDKDSGKWWQWSGFIIRHSNGLSSTATFIIRSYCKIIIYYVQRGLHYQRRRYYICVFEESPKTFVCLLVIDFWKTHFYKLYSFIYIIYRLGKVYSIQHYVMQFARDLLQVDGFLRLLRVSSTNKIDRHDIIEILLIDWLIDWLMFNVQRAIFQLYSGREHVYNK